MPDVIFTRDLEAGTQCECGCLAPCECGCCGWHGPARALNPIQHIELRIMAGEIVPAGECPDCGMFAHVTDNKDSDTWNPVDWS